MLTKIMSHARFSWNLCGRRPAVEGSHPGLWNQARSRGKHSIIRTRYEIRAGLKRFPSPERSLLDCVTPAVRLGRPDATVECDFVYFNVAVLSTFMSLPRRLSSLTNSAGQGFWATEASISTSPRELRRLGYPVKVWWS